MVWLHGGAFQVSSGSPASFGPKLFMDFDVILVSINYRLGPLGFLSLEDDQAPGNLGLWDQQMAIEWVKREAPNFCGDPDKINLIGSGSGAESVIYQMMSPSNKGKSNFASIIAQSGTPLGDPMLKLNKPKSNAYKLAARLGCKPEEALECLRKVSAPKLITAGMESLIHDPGVWIGKALSLSPWRPIVDGSFADEPFVIDDPEVTMKSEDFDKVPAILGTTAEEAVSHVAPFMAHPILFANFTETLPTLLFGKPRKDNTPRDDAIAKLVKK